jgi:sugar/nucleoside kinase (ribokinase family)
VTVVVVGDVMVDVVARHRAPLAHGSDTPADVRLRPGGAGGNVAAWLAYAGARVALVAQVGVDALAEVALSRLDGVDLHVTRAAAASTGVCIVLVDAEAERTMLPDPGANLGLSAVEAAPALFASGNVLYLSGYALLRPESRPAAQSALARARARGMRVVVDSASAGPLRGAPDFLEWTGAVDLLLANAEEADVLGARVHEVAGEVVVKHGAAGATWSDGTTEVSVPAAPATVRDTTGAGDAFAAGFLSAWPGPVEAALTRGGALAAEAVAVVGARPDPGAQSE